MINKNIIEAFESVYKEEGIKQAILFLEKREASQEEIIELCSKYNEPKNLDVPINHPNSVGIMCACGKINCGMQEMTIGQMFHENLFHISGLSQSLDLDNFSSSKSVSSESKKSVPFYKRIFGLK